MPLWIERASSRYFEWVVRHPRRVLVLCLLVAIVSAVGFAQVRFSPDSRVFFGADNPQKAALDRLERTYLRFNNVLIALAPRDGTVFTPRTLALVEQLTEAGWRMPHSSRVDSLANFSRSFARDDEIVVEPLFKRAAALTAEQIARVKRLALEDRELVNRMVSPSGDVAGVNILVVLPGKSRNEIEETTQYARALVAEARRTHPEIDFYLSGGVMVDTAFAEAGLLDFSTLLPLMLGLIAATLWIAFRSGTATLATGLVVVGAVLAAVGLFTSFGTPLNSATAGAPVIVMTIGILDSAHIVATMWQEMRAGREKRAAIVESLKLNNLAIFTTSLTDVIGFLTLNFAESPPLVDLGNMVTVGVVAAYIYSLTLLPALLVLLPAPPRNDRFRFDRLMARLADFAIARRRVLLVAIGVAFAALSAGLFRIALEDNYLTYFDERFEFRRDTEFIQKRLSGIHAVAFSVPSGEEQGIARPDFLRNLDRFAEWFRKQDKVVHVIALSETIKRLHKNLNGDDPEFERIPDSRALNAQLLLFYELSTPFGRDLRSQVDVAKSSTLMTVILRDVSSSDVKRFARAGEEWLRRNAPGMSAEATGLSVAYAYITENNIRAMLLGTVIGLTLVSLTMLLTIGDWRLGLLSLVPNLAPAAMAFGLWGYLAGEVNLAASVVASFTFGIIVDDTVHFVTKYAYGRRALGLPREDSVRYAFRVAGTPMLVASFVLVAGFSVLTLSGFAVSKTMGTLSALIILLGVAVELFLLPALLLLFRERPKKRRA